MSFISDTENLLDSQPVFDTAAQSAKFYLELGENILIHYLRAKGLEPTQKQKEGFRLLALQRQGCKGDPSFNACRETAREIAWHYNLLTFEPEHEDVKKRAKMMHMVTKHLFLFISNKMMDEKTGEFCCSAKANRLRQKEMETGGIDG